MESESSLLGPVDGKEDSTTCRSSGRTSERLRSYCSSSDRLDESGEDAKDTLVHTGTRFDFSYSGGAGFRDFGD